MRLREAFGLKSTVNQKGGTKKDKSPLEGKRWGERLDSDQVIVRYKKELAVHPVPTRRGNGSQRIYKIILSSMRRTPFNWRPGVFEKIGEEYTLVNLEEKMSVWIANDAWGLSANYKGQNYGGVKAVVFPWSIRRKILKEAHAIIEMQKVIEVLNV